MTTINSWEVLTNDGWQHNFYGTTAHQFTYRTNDQQRKREESAETELGLHSNAITIKSFSISDVKNIFTGNSISFSQVHQSWATQISGLPLFFLFFCPQFFFFLWMNSLRRKVWDVANLVGCMSIFTSHLQFVLFIFFYSFFSFFLVTLHESIAPSSGGISRTDKGILQFPSKRLTLKTIQREHASQLVLYTALEKVNHQHLTGELLNHLKSKLFKLVSCTRITCSDLHNSPEYCALVPM